MSKKRGEFARAKIEKEVFSMPIFAVTKKDQDAFYKAEDRQQIMDSVKKSLANIKQRKEPFLDTVSDVAKEAVKADQNLITNLAKRVKAEFSALEKHLTNYEGKALLIPDDNLEYARDVYKNVYEELLEQIEEFNGAQKSFTDALSKSLAKREWHRPKERDIEVKEAPVTIEQLQALTRKVIGQYEGKIESRKQRHKPSVVHPHGQTGLAAAYKLQDKLNNTESVPEYLQTLNDYVQNEESPGKFNPGSFKTRMAGAFTNAEWMNSEEFITRKDKEPYIKSALDSSCKNFLKQNYPQEMGGHRAGK